MRIVVNPQVPPSFQEVIPERLRGHVRYEYETVSVEYDPDNQIYVTAVQTGTIYLKKALVREVV